MKTNKVKNNECIDSVYQQWCNIVKENMYSDIPYKVFNISGRGRQKHRPGKPWWSSLLTDLWSQLCTAEKKVTELSCEEC